MRTAARMLAIPVLCAFLGWTAAGAETISVEPEAAVEEAIPVSPELDEETELAGTALADEAELAEGYIYSQLPHRRLLRAARLSGARLAEPSRNLYTALRTQVSQVAAGQESSTEFVIPYGDVFVNSFTLEELGVEAILDSEGKITDEAKKAALAATVQNRSEVSAADAVRCLMNDSPYELYWYDKTEGHGAKISSAPTSYSASSAKITVKGNYTVRMSVSEDYAVQTLTEEGELVREEYEVDTRFGESAAAAAENAAAILAAHKDQSDEEKLRAYKDAICALTDYNYDAEKNAKTTPYGDPWQIIWVFDGKANTKVVCEGYAKAFQYLCDLGTAEATAISVQGTTSGAHMWNLVSLRGHNYLVDVTNCDLGYDLFLKGSAEGDPASGYQVYHSRGSLKYAYDEEQQWTEEELTLYGMDYADWKAIAEKTPEVEVSSDVLYPGYAVVARLVNEEGVFAPTEVRMYRTESGTADESETAADDTVAEMKTVTLETADSAWRISEAGTYTFTAVRDGAESAASEPVNLTAAEFPQAALRLPAGTEVQEGAFAGNESAKLVVAEDCLIRSGAFTDSGVLAAILSGESTAEADAFDENVVLCLDEMTEWPDGWQFVVK